jgi:hypothetical protein
MANVLTDNPLIIDTTSGTVLFSGGRAKVTQIEFEGYLNETDACEVQNTNGKTIWYGPGRADLDTVRSGRIGWVYGLLIPVNMTNGNKNLNTGRILIYFE